MKRLKTGFIWAVGLSLFLHGTALLVSTLGFSDFFEKLEKERLQSTSSGGQVLLDLSDREEEEEREKYAAFVSSKNIRARGARNHLTGINVPGMEQNLNGRPNLVIAQDSSGKAPEKTESKDGTIKSPESGNNTSENQNSQSANFSLMSEASYTVRLRLDDSQADLKLGSQSYEYAEFLQNFGQAFFKPFVQFARASSWNASLMKTETIRVLASVDKSGRISFEKNLEVSRNQPYMNYMAERSLQIAESIPRVPTRLFPAGEDRILIPLIITFTEDPPVWSLSIPRL